MALGAGRLGEGRIVAVATGSEAGIERGGMMALRATSRGAVDEVRLSSRFRRLRRKNTENHQECDKPDGAEGEIPTIHGTRLRSIPRVLHRDSGGSGRR
jgi:hypothetical protein